jgi:glyoxylase-like metal-dependent hydrolase (beta-lactamase superfamily II)
MQILRDVYLVSGFAFGVNPNVYAIRGPQGVVLIDTGLDENELAIVDRNLSYWKLTSLPLMYVLLTHGHFDHSGNAHILRQRGARIVAGKGDAEGIEAGDNRTVGYGFGKRFVLCTVDIKVGEGDVVSVAGLQFEVIGVPGHSRGCVFYRLRVEDKVVLFTGDVVRVGTNCESGKLGWSGGVDYDREAYLDSLARIAEMDCDVILAGHFQPCLCDGWKILPDTYKVALLDWRPPATND